MTPSETKDNAYEEFWGDKQIAVWYVMVFLEWPVIPVHSMMKNGRNL